ncbi:MAG: Asp-tRNA(Asn)/Glu-tRNA(Gln) amidotransferase subunit GatC [Actinobacteria bacterium]|nr:Asp-tRNA(Asn)/Glu-tRNA(Gln) amidotransferase subunit GatC [Actinomycetota bacterium]
MVKTISKDDVKHIAKIAELEFGDDELNKITAQLDKILAHVAKIGEVDTSEIPPTSHTLKIKNVFREDNVKKPLSKEEVLSNAPEEKDGGFLVPKID